MTASGLSSTSARTIDVEATFTDFIRAYGGEVGRDLFGASPDFANADYVFRSRKVVAELKRLVEDKSEDAEIRQKISTARTLLRDSCRHYYQLGETGLCCRLTAGFAESRNSLRAEWTACSRRSTMTSM
jgi:hypothetical protein